MTPIKRCVVIMLVVALSLGATPIVPPASAQSQAACDAAIEKLERETQQLGRDLDADVKDVIKSDVAETSLRGIRNHYKGKPTADAVFDLKDKWDSFNSYAEMIKNARVTMEDLGRCINTRGCSLIEFAKRQNEVIAKWIEKLGEEGLTAAAERVNKAASVIRNYAERTLNTGMGGALDTVNKCNARIEQQANTNNTPANQQAPGRTGGGGAGKAVALIAATGAAVGGALYASKLAGDLGESFATPTTTSSTTSSTTTTTTSTFNGTSYRVIASRTCQVGSVNANPLNPGFIEPCNSAIAGGSCSPTDFQMTVSSGSVRDCGPWLNGTVSSSGAISAEYNGVCGATNSGVRFSGQLPASGSANFTATGTCRANNYTVQLSISRQQ